jgi:plasmid stabilization system protein ParE
MKVEILRSAESDLVDGANIYEDQAPGLGTYFLDCLEAEIASLTRLAGIHERVSGRHRMISRKFPSFAIFYRVEDSVARVGAVFDCRRDPEWIKNRLSQ